MYVGPTPRGLYVKSRPICSRPAAGHAICDMRSHGMRGPPKPTVFIPGEHRPLLLFKTGAYFRRVGNA